MDLRGRKIYPADWQSFILNPLEVLGVAAGLAFPSISAEHRKWFANTIICGMTQSQFRTPLSQLAPHTALAMVNDLEGRNRAAALDVESMGISDLVLAAASQLAFGELVAGDEVRIEQALMSRALRAAIRSAMRRSRGTRVFGWPSGGADGAGRGRDEPGGPHRRIPP
jgi:hypothetical protein